MDEAMRAIIRGDFALKTLPMSMETMTLNRHSDLEPELKEVMRAFIEATDVREFPNWDDASKPAPWFVAMARLLKEARRPAVVPVADSDSYSLVFVDCEAQGASPSTGRMTEMGLVTWKGDELHFLLQATEKVKANAQVSHDEGIAMVSAVGRDEAKAWAAVDSWLTEKTTGRVVMVSDNPAYDFQWVNDGFHRTLGRNPFGHSARRIGDFYAGLVGDFRKASDWKRLRLTVHDHHPVHDARGNLEAVKRVFAGERG